MILCSIVLNNRKLRTINSSYKNKSEYIITVNDQNGMKDSYKKVQYITLFVIRRDTRPFHAISSCK